MSDFKNFHVVALIWWRRYCDERKDSELDARYFSIQHLKILMFFFHSGVCVICLDFQITNRQMIIFSLLSLPSPYRLSADKRRAELRRGQEALPALDSSTVTESD